MQHIHPIYLRDAGRNSTFSHAARPSCFGRNTRDEEKGPSLPILLVERKKENIWIDLKREENDGTAMRSKKDSQNSRYHVPFIVCSFVFGLRGARKEEKRREEMETEERGVSSSSYLSISQLR